MGNRLLVIDSSYAYEAIRDRQLEASVTCRDLGGFFEHVWSVHPFGSLVSSRAVPKCGVPATHEISATHTFIDGKIGRFPLLAGIGVANFLIAQSDLFARLRALIVKERIDVIRAGDPLYNGLLGFALARACAIPLVIRVNSNYDKIVADTGRAIMPRLFRSYSVEKRVVRFLLPRVDLVAAPNEDNLRFALANGAPAERSTLFRYGNLIDKRHLVQPAARSWDDANLSGYSVDGRRFLLYVGRLEPVKRPDDVVRVLAEVRRRGHDVSAVLVGDGEMRAELVALATDLGVHEHCAFVGNRSQGWLAEAFARAAAVVSPHTGRALAEAAFGAAPIAAYDLDWQGELVHDNETGVLVPAGDWAALARGVDHLLSDSANARRLGDAVRAKALVMLDPERLDEHERQQYRRLILRAA